MEEQTKQAKKIWVVTAEPEEENAGGARNVKIGSGPNSDRDIWSQPAALAARGVQVGTDILEQQMSEFLDGIGQMFSSAQEKIAGTNLELNEIELAVEISGKGEVKLLGTGGEAAAKGAIKLKFGRRKV
ncbi:hypothetical protein KR51_00004860 [Rubidibacter lacunae KORDI 51-2]|uniref:Pepco domain-containing protein n=1 Tax=Rubidibacter lacunae KORDI 51-2 TaxID=582515 RepID=U5DPI5_9CHRO|nr:hypothetical protein [Rubidibacter lacunae]ERN42772.1 hypothetical protein KR51_00004860 [Rubidibacter lacunae KORDI 51-2]